MLKRNLKLKTFEIKNIFSKNETKKSLIKVERTFNFDIKFFFNQEEKENLKHDKIRFSVIASIKTFKTAINRNKVRRIFYTISENYLKNKDQKKIQDIKIIFYPKKDSLKQEYDILEKDVIMLLNKNI
ncbi:MAG: ribonuclease P protein component [Candidatus Pacebacteria bacterium]|nr:ribonuclease P protein component [Candidatus Paceibacterota bacterium]